MNDGMNDFPMSVSAYTSISQRQLVVLVSIKQAAKTPRKARPAQPHTRP